MAQRATANKAQVIRSGRSQSVRLPTAIRFASNEVFIQRDEHSCVVTLSEKPLQPSLAQIFHELDEMKSSDYVLERDSLPTVEREAR